jgi:hypothetical protein
LEKQQHLRCHVLGCVKKTAELLRTGHAPTPPKKVCYHRLKIDQFPQAVPICH